MKCVLLTGMSGTGKSTVIKELAARGYKAVNTDDDGLSELVSVPADQPTGLDPGQDWVWREDRIQTLLSTADADVLFLGGCAPNQGKFYPRFDHVVLLTAPAHVLVERLATRTTNPYGKRPRRSRACWGCCRPSSRSAERRRVRRQYQHSARPGGGDGAPARAVTISNCAAVNAGCDQVLCVEDLDGRSVVAF